jgi:hypothetical protein
MLNISDETVERIGSEGTAILEKSQKKERKDELEEAYLFLSFDLVNSTAYKLHNNNWPMAFESFFIDCAGKTKEFIFNYPSQSLDEPPLKEWKRLGDEIIFYIKIAQLDSLWDLPKRVFLSLKNIIEALQTYNSNSEIQLSAKATLWGAVVSPSAKGKMHKNTVFNILTAKENGAILDFLGPDIDTGFRISKYASPGKLVIDAYLAWLFNKYSKDKKDEDMKIVSLETLKGIWNNRRYPIVWYYDNWLAEDVDEIFFYDEEYYSEIVKEIKRKGLKSYHSADFLEKILKESNFLKYAKKLEATIKKEKKSYCASDKV